MNITYVAPGIDNIQHEHLIYGKDALSPVLANLFTAMLRYAFIPKVLKRGVIITLFKGGNKRRDNPDSYRAITLSSVILKLYEQVVLQRSKG